ncbi:MAG: 2-isopropylmalate synthase [Clostridiales bacterium]|jgi:2-isopropylmalate synthase|nr:2-isopropylmalate synthase [Clostridiales bacterium]
MATNRIYILDTTLRDGEQTPGVNLNVPEKVNIAQQLEILGVDIIEAGFANASEGDFQAVVDVARALKTAATCSLARCNEADVKAAHQAVRFAKKPRIHTFIATSDIHMQYKLKMSPETVLQRIENSVKLACTVCDEVQFSPEDASRTDKDFLRRVLETAIEAGAKIVNLPDTVGYSTVREFGALIKYIKENVNGIDDVVLGVHCHDDLGLAVANSLEAVLQGARQVECTVNGMGERAGNAALEEIVMGLYVRKDYYGCETGINTKEIHRTSKMVAGYTNAEPSPGKAIIGANAFLHESGIHQHGVLNNRATYEVMKAEDLGMVGQGMVLGKLSGKHAFIDRAEALGYRLDKEELDIAFIKFKDLADRKRLVTDRDIEALLGGEISEVPEIYHLVSFQAYTSNVLKATATLTMMREGVAYTETAVGNGAIDAALLAVDKISGMELELLKYRVKAASEGRDAIAEVNMRVGYDDRVASGRGISPDVVEASVLSYIAGLNRLISDQYF